jgi:hypothetical protein
VSLRCRQDNRRDVVRQTEGRNGLDYVEVSDDQMTLYVYFLGRLPPELAVNKPGLERYLRIEGGERVTDIVIKDVDPVASADPERDDYLVLKLDKYGDFSTYTVRLVDVDNIDPRYDHADFSFKVNCPSELDCAPACDCEPQAFTEPEINYLAKDYQSFRQLILDRLAVLVPDWAERHAADLGITLVELLAYTGDYLSYYQDAVATEAYLDTARQRISVRRHARLVDYTLHEGCNARAWVSVEVDPYLKLDPEDVAFITGLNDALPEARQNVLDWEMLRDVPAQSYEVFEPVDRSQPVEFYAAHNEIHFHTWGDSLCCIERGSTSATLIDAWVSAGEQVSAWQQEEDEGKEEAAYDKKSKKNSEAYDKKDAAAKDENERVLRLKRGDVLIFEEVAGPVTGLAADADPTRRHAVRLTRVTKGEDALVLTPDGRPTPYLEVEWSKEDALPFTFCISAIGAAPDCRQLENLSVARGNVILVDHGKTLDEEELGCVPALHTDSECECVEMAGEIRVIAGRFSPRLKRRPLTFSTPLPSKNSRWRGASSLLSQDVRRASPQVRLTSEPQSPWEPRYDAIASGATDYHFVVEIDNEGVAHLRFGDGELGFRPSAGTCFSATYRVGNGRAGNVGAEAISRLVLRNQSLDGVYATVRNPLPARGGIDPEPVMEAKLYAPHSFRKEIERAVIADDYKRIAERNAELQRASASLVWTGSWYEADVSVDPLGREDADSSLLKGLERYLEKFRRMGHDLAVTRARYVPIRLKLEVCALPHYQPAHVKAALLDAFSNRTLTGGRRGFFHPDNLTFGQGIYLSRLIAVGQKVAGVECIRVKEFRRLFALPNREIENGVLPLGTNEIAQLDNDPNYPERGQLEIQMMGRKMI